MSNGHWFCADWRVKSRRVFRPALLRRRGQEAQVKKILVLHAGGEEELATVGPGTAKARRQRWGSARHAICYHLLTGLVSRTCVQVSNVHP
jgi:hypothetical protein